MACPKFAPALAAAITVFHLALPGPASGADLLVSSLSTNNVVRYNSINGKVLDIFAYGGGLLQPGGIAVAADGAIYVASQGTHSVLRYDPLTGEFVDVFVSAGSGGLSFPTGLVFGPDGHLYVASLGTHQILKYDKVTGAFLGVFVTTHSGGLDQPIGLTFGPDGNLFVASNFSHSVLRYNGSTGAFIDVFASGSGLNGPAGVVFGADGNLYVASGGSDSVLRYNGSTGAFISQFIAAGGGGLNDPVGLVFGPDANLYVASLQTNSVLRYSGATGASLGTFVPAGSGGLSVPTFLVFRTPPPLLAFSAGQDAKGSLAFGDFNGDGTADLAIGSFEQDVQVSAGVHVSPGAVTVVYSNALGLRSAGSATWHENRPLVPGVAANGNEFGRALAAGDFNGDGCADLAIGVPGDDFGAVNSGAVVVLYGSPRVSATNPGGLSTDTRSGDRVKKSLLDFADKKEDRFGAAVAAGDFNDDGFDDLAIGAAGESSSKGAAYVVYGSSGGLTKTGRQWWRQGMGSHGTLRGNPENNDRFGRTLTTGDFNGDGFADLAAGVPGEDTGFLLGADAGAVNVVYGGTSGLATPGNQIWTQDSEGVGEDNDRDDEFGAALAAGDFNGDGRDDLAIGIPSEDFGGWTVGPFTTSVSRKDKGRVVVLYGTTFGLSAEGDQVWDEDVLDLNAELQSRFGQALAAGDFNDDGYDDLAVGTPGAPGTTEHRDKGAVMIITGGAGGLGSHGAKEWNQDVEAVAGQAEKGDLFGAALAAADAGRHFDGRHITDLAILVKDGAFGAANVLYGSPDGLQGESTQLFECGPDGVFGVSDLITSPSDFSVIIDGRFTDTPGAGEWSDVTAGGFITSPSDPSRVLTTTEADSGLATSLFFTTLARRLAAGSGDSVADLTVMFASVARTNPQFAAGEAVADITFPIVTDEAGLQWRPVTLQIRAASGTPSPFEAFIDSDGDGLADAAPGDLGIAVGVGFGSSPLSPDPHLLIEIRLPLFIPAGFGDPGGPFPPEGLAGIYPPSTAFWTAAFARDDLAGLTPGAGAMIHIDGRGDVAMSTKVTPHGNAGVDVLPGDDTNEIDLAGKGSVQVAILTTPTFDATALSFGTVAWHNPLDLGRYLFATRSRVKDVDRDGDADLILFFRLAKLKSNGVIDASSTGAVFIAPLGDASRTVGGTDRVKIVGQ